MRQLVALFLFAIASSAASAEIQYNPVNPAHKADMVCVGALSVVRSSLFGDNDIDVSNIGLTVREATELQNQYILKYAYSRQFNQHYRARAILLKNMGAAAVVEEVQKCDSP